MLFWPLRRLDSRLVWRSFGCWCKLGWTGWLRGISQRLHLRPNTLSTHLSILTQAGLITAAREGRSIRYSADMGGLRALMSWLLQDCCGGKPETCGPILDQIACACEDV